MPKSRAKKGIPSPVRVRTDSMPASVRMWRETCLKAAECPNRPSFPALSTLLPLCLAKHRGVVITIIPFFCGARRKAELLETSLKVDHLMIFSWPQNQPWDLRETSLRFTPYWYLPHRAWRKLRRLRTNFQMQLGGSFHSLCFACCETGALKSWFSVSYSLTPA